MAYHVLLFSIGLAGLYFGAESLVRGAGRLARSLGVSALVVGLTIVAFGTSTPELVVSVMAAMRGQGNLSLGNVVGSNVANVGLILALAALIRPLTVDVRLVRRELPVMIAAGLALWYRASDGLIDRADAAVLGVAFLVYLWFLVRLARREPVAVEVTYGRFERVKIHSDRSRWHVDFGLIMIGLAGLVAGANFIVVSAVFFARSLGVSELTIGLTVVAIGTSLPELATSLLAALRGESDIAVGNIVGSNIFNTLAIVGAAAASRPLTTPASLFAFELPVMIGASALLVPMLWTGKRVTRFEGGGLLVLYVAFLWISVTGRAG
jgi:cation:H+ antiporter